jgi:hypothetical protein
MAVIRRKFTVKSANIKNIEPSQINDLMLYLKLLELQEQANLKTSKRREIIKIRAQISKIETKNKTKQEINKTKT